MRLLISIIKTVIIKLKTTENLKTIRRMCNFGSGPSINSININSSFFFNKDLISCNFISNNNVFENSSFNFYSLIDRDYTKKVNNSFILNLKTKYFIVSTKNAWLLPIFSLMLKKLNVINTAPLKIKKILILEIF